MAFEVQYRDQIQQRMKDEYRKLSNKAVIEGGFARDLINANSIEFENTYLELAMIYAASFADSSWGDFLTRKCAEFGIDRKSATYSVGEVVFTGSANVTIPAGTTVGVSGGIAYTTDYDVVIDSDGTAKAEITCSELGSDGNVNIGAIDTIFYPITGVTSVTNIEATHDGYDEENDDELFLRYIIAMRTPATSGNAYHYYNWASEVEGVGVVKVIPLWNGPGTVKVLLLDSNGEVASDSLIQAVQQNIEDKRPIGAEVTVATAKSKVVNIEVDIKGTLDTDALISEIYSYASDKGLDIKYLSYAQVGDMIMNQELVEDWDNLKLNGGSRVVFDDDEILGIGGVTVNAFVT